MNQINSLKGAARFLASVEPDSILRGFDYYDKHGKPCDRFLATQRISDTSISIHVQRKRLIPFAIDGWRIRRSQWKTVCLLSKPITSDDKISFKRPPDYRAA